MATRAFGADTFTATVAPLIAETQAAGAKSLRQIAAALNGRGIVTARGGKWEAAKHRQTLTSSTRSLRSSSRNCIVRSA